MGILKKEWKKLLLFGSLILLVAIFLRFYHLTILPVFGDEAIYLRWSQVMREQPAFRFLPLSDGKQPLYMWVTITFFKVFSDPLVAGRSLSILTGLGTLVGIFLVVQVLFKNVKASLVSASIYAVCPLVIFFDRMALADSMLSMFGVWTLLFSILTVEYIRFDLSMVTGFLLGGALLTKSPALFFSLLIPSTWLLFNWSREPKKIVSQVVSLVVTFIPTYLIGYGLYNILRLGIDFPMLAKRNLDYVWPYAHILSSPLDPLIPHFKGALTYLWTMGPGTLLLLAILGIVVNFRGNWKKIIVVSLWFILPLLAVTEYAKVFTARYMLFTLPPLIILAASLFVNTNKIISKVALAILAVFILHSLFIDYQLLVSPEKVNMGRSERSGYLEEWTAGQGLKEVADFVRAEQLKNPGEKIVVGTEGYFGSMPDGLQIYLNDMKEINVYGVGIDIRTLPDELKQIFADGIKTYLVVNNVPGKPVMNLQNLKEIARYPKAIKPDGTNESLVLYEVVK